MQREHPNLSWWSVHFVKPKDRESEGMRMSAISVTQRTPLGASDHTITADMTMQGVSVWFRLTST